MLDALSDHFGFEAFLSSMESLYMLLLFIMQCGWLANYMMRQMKLGMRQRGIETALSSISVSGILLYQFISRTLLMWILLRLFTFLLRRRCSVHVSHAYRITEYDSPAHFSLVSSLIPLLFLTIGLGFQRQSFWQSQCISQNGILRKRVASVGEFVYNV